MSRAQDSTPNANDHARPRGATSEIPQRSPPWCPGPATPVPSIFACSCPPFWSSERWTVRQRVDPARQAPTLIGVEGLVNLADGQRQRVPHARQLAELSFDAAFDGRTVEALAGDGLGDAAARLVQARTQTPERALQLSHGAPDRLLLPG